MLSPERSIASILRHWPQLQARVSHVHSLRAATGFSGSRLWRIETPDDCYCLKRWSTPHPSVQQLQFVHRVLEHVVAQGLPQLAVPLRTAEQTSFVAVDGYLWELTTWMPGRADFWENPSKARLNAVMTLLAQFHQQAATAPVTEPGEPLFGSSPSHPGYRPPLGLTQRHDLLAFWQAGQLAALERKVASGSGWQQLDDLARCLLTLAPGLLRPLANEVQRAMHVQVPTQPCIRDLWHDHVLFQADAVSGIIDFGGMRVDSVAADLARLVGSLVGDDRSRWAEALDSYQSVRPLSENERQLVFVYDRSSVLLSGLNWLRWLYLEQRQFDSRTAVLERLHRLLERLEVLAAELLRIGGTDAV